MENLPIAALQLKHSLSFFGKGPTPGEKFGFLFIEDILL